MSSLPSSLEITAKIDAALAEAGLAGPQVEREPLPLFHSFIGENMDGVRFQPGTPLLRIAEAIIHWGMEHHHSLQDLKLIVGEIMSDVIELTKAHGTLTDLKRHELLTRHDQLILQVDQLYRQKTSANKWAEDWR